MMFFSKLTIGFSLASLMIIGLLPMGLFSLLSSRDQIDLALILQTIGILMFFSFPYIVVILLARARPASKSRQMTVLCVGAIICVTGVAAFAFDTYSYHVATGDSRTYYQRFIPQLMAAVVQYIGVAWLTFSKRSPRRNSRGL